MINDNILASVVIFVYLLVCGQQYIYSLVWYVEDSSICIVSVQILVMSFIFSANQIELKRNFSFPQPPESYRLIGQYEWGINFKQIRDIV